MGCLERSSNKAILYVTASLLGFICLTLISNIITTRRLKQLLGEFNNISYIRALIYNFLNGTSICN